jgi:nucleotide-binding universal stress UspA family protein
MAIFRHILVATDGTPHAMRAVHAGVELARSLGAEMTFVNCSVPFDAFAGDPLAMTHRDEYEAAVSHAAREALSAGVRKAREVGLAAARVHCYASQPYQGILDIAASRHCDAIVMAPYGRKGAAARLIGSQTHKVLTHTRLPVLVCLGEGPLRAG